jgi:Protein kinase domain
MFASVAARSCLVYRRQYRRFLEQHSKRCSLSSRASRTRVSLAGASSRSWGPAATIAVTVAAAAILASNQQLTEDIDSLGLEFQSRVKCDFLFLPSFASRRRNSPEVQQKQASRKRNNTMELIESFSAAERSDEKSLDASLAKGGAITATPANTTSSPAASKHLTVDSRYEIDWQNRLGVGAFGGVFEGIHRITKRHVAVKQIPKQCTEYATFQREMDALARIAKAGGHPNINTLRETFVGGSGNESGSSNEEGEPDDNYYLVLDLITGTEMFDHLCEKGAYSEGKR